MNCENLGLDALAALASQSSSGDAESNCVGESNPLASGENKSNSGPGPTVASKSDTSESVGLHRLNQPGKQMAGTEVAHSIATGGGAQQVVPSVLNVAGIQALLTGLQQVAQQNPHSNEGLALQQQKGVEELFLAHQQSQLQIPVVPPRDDADPRGVFQALFNTALSGQMQGKARV